MKKRRAEKGHMTPTPAPATRWMTYPCAALAVWWCAEQTMVDDTKTMGTTQSNCAHRRATPATCAMANKGGQRLKRRRACFTCVRPNCAKFGPDMDRLSRCADLGTYT